MIAIVSLFVRLLRDCLLSDFYCYV